MSCFDCLKYTGVTKKKSTDRYIINCQYWLEYLLFIFSWLWKILLSSPHLNKYLCCFVSLSKYPFYFSQHLSAYFMYQEENYSVLWSENYMQNYPWYSAKVCHYTAICDDIICTVNICSKYVTLHEELLLKVNQKFLEVQQPVSVEIFNCFYEVFHNYIYHAISAAFYVL